MYVCGGEEDSLILANGEVYDPQEDIWTEMNASMSTPRCEFGMCAHDGFLYAFGGWVGEDIGGSIERYDTVTDRYDKYRNESVRDPQLKTNKEVLLDLIVSKLFYLLL